MASSRPVDSHSSVEFSRMLEDSPGVSERAVRGEFKAPSKWQFVVVTLMMIGSLIGGLAIGLSVGNATVAGLSAVAGLTSTIVGGFLFVHLLDRKERAMREEEEDHYGELPLADFTGLPDFTGLREAY